MVKFMLEVSIGGRGGGGVIGDINSYYYLYIGHRQIPPPPRSLIYGNYYKTNYILSMD